MTDPSAGSAGVRIDPQLIYLLPLGLAVLVHVWRPIAVWPRSLGMPVGVGLIVLGVMLLRAAVRRFAANATSLQPWEPSTALITDGPFRYSRNPVYLGYLLVYLGVASWVNTLWALIALPLVLGAMQGLVIRREEAYLERRFGDGYRDYRRRVRRWL